MALPLWKILLKLNPTQPTASLTCEECFIILEFLADEAARGADLEGLLHAVREHLNHCPGCREH